MAESTLQAVASTPTRHWRLPHDWRSQTSIAVALIFGALVML